MKTKSTTVSTRRVADAIRYAPNPIPQLTPKNLAAYLDSFARGIAEHLEAAKRDPS